MKHRVDACITNIHVKQTYMPTFNTNRGKDYRPKIQR